MASNYWSSTQNRNWTYTRDALAQVRLSLEGDGLLVQQFPLPEYRLLSIYFYHQLLKLIKRLNLRQAPLATAQVYLRRFYTKVPLRQTNPYLMLATALYVACKIEESPQNIRIIVAESRNFWPEYIGPDVASLGEAEFRLISTMDSELILHHPYRTLKYLEITFQLAADEAGLAWGVVNDSYMTDLALLYAPHVIAWAATFIALTVKSGSGMTAAGGVSGGDMAERMLAALQEANTASHSSRGNSGIGVASHQARLPRFLETLAESEVDLAAVSDAVQEIVSLYLLWETFREKEIKEQLGRFVKARGLDK